MGVRDDGYGGFTVGPSIDEAARPSPPRSAGEGGGRRVVLDLDEETARKAADLIRTHIIGMNAAGDLLLAIDTALEGDRPQRVDDVEYGVCVGGALIDTGTNRSMADAWVNALIQYRDQRADFGDAAEPIQIFIWPRPS